MKVLLQIEKDKYQKKETSYAGEALAAHVVYITADEEQELEVKVKKLKMNRLTDQKMLLQFVSYPCFRACNGFHAYIGSTRKFNN